MDRGYENVVGEGATGNAVLDAQNLFPQISNFSHKLHNNLCTPQRIWIQYALTSVAKNMR